jgi:hypothetical protein
MRPRQTALEHSCWQPRQLLHVGFKISRNHRIEHGTCKVTRHSVCAGPCRPRGRTAHTPNQLLIRSGNNRSRRQHLRPVNPPGWQPSALGAPKYSQTHCNRFAGCGRLRQLRRSMSSEQQATHECGKDCSHGRSLRGSPLLKECSQNLAPALRDFVNRQIHVAGSRIVLHWRQRIALSLTISSERPPQVHDYSGQCSDLLFPCFVTVPVFCSAATRSITPSGRLCSNGSYSS